MNSSREKNRMIIEPVINYWKWILISLAAILLIAAAWFLDPSSAKAEPDLSLLKAAYAESSVVNQTQGGGSPITIPAAAFRVDGNARQWFFGFNSAYLYPNGAAAYCGIAPVYLPDGALVTSFTSYLFDNDATNDASVYLYAKPLGTTVTSTTMANVSTTLQNANLQTLTDTSITQAFIDNSAYTYHIGVCLFGATNDLRFYAARVDFKQFLYIPNILK